MTIPYTTLESSSLQTESTGFLKKLEEGFDGKQGLRGRLLLTIGDYEGRDHPNANELITLDLLTYYDNADPTGNVNAFSISKDTDPEFVKRFERYCVKANAKDTSKPVSKNLKSFVPFYLYNIDSSGQLNPENPGELRYLALSKTNQDALIAFKQSQTIDDPQADLTSMDISVQLETKTIGNTSSTWFKHTYIPTKMDRWSTLPKDLTDDVKVQAKEFLQSQLDRQKAVEFSQAELEELYSHLMGDTKASTAPQTAHKDPFQK